MIDTFKLATKALAVCEGKLIQTSRYRCNVIILSSVKFKNKRYELPILHLNFWDYIPKTDKVVLHYRVQGVDYYTPPAMTLALTRKKPLNPHSLGLYGLAYRLMLGTGIEYKYQGNTPWLNKLTSDFPDTLKNPSDTYLQGTSRAKAFFNVIERGIKIGVHRSTYHSLKSAVKFSEFSGMIPPNQLLRLATVIHLNSKQPFEKEAKLTCTYR